MNFQSSSAPCDSNQPLISPHVRIIVNITVEHDAEGEAGAARAAGDGHHVPADVQTEGGRGQERQHGLQPQVRFGRDESSTHCVVHSSLYQFLVLIQYE